MYDFEILFNNFLIAKINVFCINAIIITKRTNSLLFFYNMLIFTDWTKLY